MSRIFYGINFNTNSTVCYRVVHINQRISGIDKFSISIQNTAVTLEIYSKDLMGQTGLGHLFQASHMAQIMIYS